jgi:hypothetical protein
MSDFDIGYRKPPVTTRFAKGKSGNPKGRPKGARNLKTDLEEELQELIPISERGRKMQLSKQRVLIKTLTARAIGGDARALTTLLNFALKIIDPAAQPLGSIEISADDQRLIDEFLAREGHARPKRKE